MPTDYRLAPRDYAVPERRWLRTATIITLAAILGAMFLALCASMAHGQTVDLRGGCNPIFVYGAAAPTVKVPAGIFALQSAQTLSRPISEAQLRLKGVDGLTIRIDTRWAPSDADAFVKASVDRAHRTNDQFTILVKGGVSNTPWTDAELAKHFAVAKRYAIYDTDPLCVGVHAFCAVAPPNVSEEPYWDSITPLIEAAYRKAIDWYADNFPHCTLLCPVVSADTAGCERLVSYAMQKAPGRVLAKTNNLKAKNKGKSILTASQHQAVVRLGRRGAMIGWEMVGSTSEPRFEGTLQQAYNNAKTLAAQADRPISYLAIYPTDLTSVGALR